jgi:hypothetical protein
VTVLDLSSSKLTIAYTVNLRYSHRLLCISETSIPLRIFLSSQKRRTRKAERAKTEISSEKLEIVIWQIEIRVAIMVTHATGKKQNGVSLL